MDNDALTAPNAETLFIAERTDTVGLLGRCVRLSVSDIAEIDSSLSENPGGVMVWLNKIYTGENASDKTWRVFPCSPLYTDP